jgi:hypothetical protein
MMRTELTGEVIEHEWSRIVVEDREVARRVGARADELLVALHAREAQIATIREVARQAGERAVELYLADLAESEWMREKRSCRLRLGLDM